MQCCGRDGDAEAAKQQQKHLTPPPNARRQPFQRIIKTTHTSYNTMALWGEIITPQMQLPIITPPQGQ